MDEVAAQAAWQKKWMPAKAWIDALHQIVASEGERALDAILAYYSEGTFTGYLGFFPPGDFCVCFAR